MQTQWIGKLIGALIGLFKGGVWGALLGGFIGHWFDQLWVSSRRNKEAQQIFSDALYAAMGFMAKSDGRVSEEEIAVAEVLFERLRLSPQARRRAIEQFNKGKQAGFRIDLYLKKFARMALLRMDLKQMFMEILLEAAFADGKMTAKERVVVDQVAQILRVPAVLVEQLIAAWGPWQSRSNHQSYQRPGPNQQTAGPDPYKILGVGREASVAQIKRAYRKLMSQHHPDKLVSRGLPEEMVELAKEKARDINQAYDQIKQSRGFK